MMLNTFAFEAFVKTAMLDGFDGINVLRKKQKNKTHQGETQDNKLISCSAPRKSSTRH